LEAFKIEIIKTMSDDILDKLLSLCESLHYQYSEAVFDKKWKRTWLEKFLNNENNEIFIVVNDTIVAYALVELKTEEYSRRKYILLREIFVDKKYRSLSLGTWLLEDVINNAKHNGVDYISLETRNEESYKFFQKCGFSIFSTNLRYSL